MATFGFNRMALRYTAEATLNVLYPIFEDRIIIMGAAILHRWTIIVR